jgi:hypothetical protein
MSLPMVVNDTKSVPIKTSPQSSSVTRIPPRQKAIPIKASFNWDEDFSLKFSDFTHLRSNPYGRPDCSATHNT